MLVNNKLVTNFKDKSNIFNDFSSKQCQPIPNNSTLPSIQTFESSNRLSTADVDSKKKLKNTEFKLKQTSWALWYINKNVKNLWNFYNKVTFFII